MDRINAAGIQEVKIRSVLTCEAKNGVCGQVATGATSPAARPSTWARRWASIAAQSIGEPGTQLTMRTFHIGGAAQIADSSFIESNFDGTVRVRKPAPRPQRRGRPHGHGPQRGHRHRGLGRRGAGGAPRPVRRAAEGRRGRQDQARAADRRMGSLHASDHDRGRRRGGLRGSRRGPFLDRDDRRGHRHRQAHGHRLAHEPALVDAQAGDGRSRAPTARSSSCSAAARLATSCPSTRSSRSSRAAR